MEKNNPEIPQNIEEGAREVPPAVSGVGGKIIKFTPAETEVSEAPFVPELEIAPIAVGPVADRREGMPGGLPVNSIDRTDALQRQFEGTETTAAGTARRTVIEFNGLKEGSQ